VAGSTHNYYLCFLRLVRFLSSTSPDPDPDQFCVSSPLTPYVSYLFCVPMLLVRLRCVFERLRLVLLVRRRRVSSSSEIKSFNLSAIVWLVSLANNETLCADTASIWSSSGFL
jgi:hypothetical protein